MIKKVLITGGAGYVRSALSDELIDKNYEVTVLDLCIYGKNVFKNASKINLIKGDISKKFHHKVSKTIYIRIYFC